MPSFPCPTCGTPRTGDSELCPRCLFQQAVDVSDTASEEETLDSFERSDSPAPRQVGDYEILEELGRGGMGVVYLARQRSLDRVVAVKLLLGGLWAPQEARERFLREARAAAALHHPGIVAIHEAGEQEGLLFLSMDYVAGTDLDRHLRAGFYVSPEQAARWCAEAARAIGFAHERGILHRDLKPSNVLIASDGHLVVTDFGLARPIGEPGPTITGQVLGSPGFLPPERLIDPSAEGPQGDVYSLGALLYTLLTGRPPITGDDAVEVLLKAREAEIVPPRSLDRTIPRDLESVCLRCLARDPANRYLNAGELAEELERFLAGEDVEARPLRAPQRLGRWLWRRRRRAWAVAAVAAVLFVGYQTLRERRLPEPQGVRRDGAAPLAQTPQEDPPQKKLAARDRRESSDAAAKRQAVAREWAAFSLHRFREVAMPGFPIHLDFSLDGKRLAALVGHDGTKEWVLHLYDTETGELLQVLSGYVDRERPLHHFHAAIADYRDSVAHVFDPVTGRIVDIPVDPRRASRVAQNFWCFDPGGRYVAFMGVGFTLRVWDLERGELAVSSDQVGTPEVFLAPDKLIFRGLRDLSALSIPSGAVDRLVEGRILSLSPDAKTAAVRPQEAENRVLLRDIWETREVGELGYDAPGYLGSNWSPDGRWLAVGQLDGPAQVWEVHRRPLRPVWLALSGQKTPRVTDAQFSPDNRWLAVPVSERQGKSVLIFDTSTGELQETLTDHELAIWHPRGDVLLTSSFVERDSPLLVGPAYSNVGAVFWRVEPATPVYPAPSDWGPFSSEVRASELVWSADGRHLHSREPLLGGELLWELVSTSPPRLRLAKVPGSPPSRPKPPFPPEDPPEVEIPGTRRVAAGGPRDTIELRLPGDPPEVVRRWEGHQGRILALGVDPDGRWLASGGTGVDLVFWRLDDEEEWLRLPAHRGGVTALAFHPSGDVLVSKGKAGELKVWDLKELLEVLAENGL